MNEEDFKKSPSGFLVPTINGCKAFVPHPLPPNRSLDLQPSIRLIEASSRLLGELSGMGNNLPDPNLLISPFARKEAVASSKIEGTVTTLDELFAYEVGADSGARSDTREVHNYIRALNHGIDRVADIPVSNRLIRELHEELMRGVAPHRGARIIPSEFKTDQNWIGARVIQNARFVPPPPPEAMEAMSSLERFINDERDGLPLLVKMALVHYQFETIHPFPDGNGRVGRLIIPLILYERGAISQPLMYLSNYFEQNYDDYIDRMYDISEKGLWEPWIEFFLAGVEVSCRDAIQKAQAVLDLHADYHNRIRTARSSALLADMVDHLFRTPATTIPFMTQNLGVTYNSAKNNISKLIDLGILSPLAADWRPRIFFAREIVRTISDDPLHAETGDPQD